MTADVVRVSNVVWGVNSAAAEALRIRLNGEN